jgi:hypothetical protein
MGDWALPKIERSGVGIWVLLKMERSVGLGHASLTGCWGSRAMQLHDGSWHICLPRSIRGR